VKRTTKRRLRQGGLYAVLLAVVVYLALTIDWAKVRDNFWVSGLSDNWHDLILTGVKNTVVYTFCAFAGGLVLALVLALMKLSSVAPYRWIATAYIEFFRGLPALITILVMAFGVPIATGWRPPGGGAGAAVVGLMIVAGAYMAETLRAGLQAVPKGQSEAARSLGMSGFRTMVHIVIPQAFRIIIPPLTNEFVLVIKDTSLISVVGSTLSSRELTNTARDFMTGSDSMTAGTATSLTQAALLYLVITLPLTQLVAWLERRQRRAR
jgi:polar amino acid transport system permease protein